MKRTASPRGRALMVLLGFVALGASTLLATTSPASAAATLALTNNTNVASGTVVGVSGSGYTGIGSIIECNNAPGEPTVAVATASVPVGCTNPLLSLITFASGAIPSGTTFTVKAGVIGPPATGTDSAGNSAAADAAN